MSKIKSVPRFIGPYMSDKDKYVRASDYDTALSQLATLREELANADPKGSFDKHMQYMRENAELQTRLADAERRNAEFFELLSRWYELNAHGAFLIHDSQYKIVTDTAAALTKPEEAKS